MSFHIKGVLKLEVYCEGFYTFGPSQMYTCCIKIRVLTVVVHLIDFKMDIEYKKFNARSYLEERTPGNEFESDDLRIHTHWGLKCLHNFYEKYHVRWDNSSATLLEFGAGPYIHTLISAAPYVGKIYHTDYLEECRQEALLWMKNDPKAYDWTPYFKYIVNTLEGKSGTDAIAERKKLLRSKFQDSLFLDMKSNGQLFPSHPEPFDIVYTGFCIESVMMSLEEFKEVIKKIFGILKPNGFLVMLVNQICTWFTVNDVKYPSLSIRIDEVLAILEEVGFTLFYVEAERKEYKEGVKYYSDKEYYGHYVARKVV